MILVAATSHHSHTSSVPPAFIRTTRLKFFGHTERADPSMDPSQALRACVAPLSRDWNRRSGRPRHTWLRTGESDLAPLNIGLATAYDLSAESSSLEHARMKLCNSGMYGNSTVKYHSGVTVPSGMHRTRILSPKLCPT